MLVPLFIFSFSLQILLATDLALDCKDTQEDLWNRICRDEYMAYAVQECYYSIEQILFSLVDGVGKLWYESAVTNSNLSVLSVCLSSYDIFTCTCYFLTGLREFFARSTQVYLRILL